MPLANDTNTLLIDDSPLKSLLNDQYNAVFPPTFRDNDGQADDFLVYRLLPYLDRLLLSLSRFPSLSVEILVKVVSFLTVRILIKLMICLGTMIPSTSRLMSVLLCCLSTDHPIHFFGIFSKILVELVAGPVPRLRSDISTTANVFRDVSSST